MIDLRLSAVEKRYGDVHAVKGIDLAVSAGEFVVLVGPSGCGKSTLLRMIAGLETLEDGTIEVGGRDVTFAAPKDRDVAMVFQNYALYPYMRVSENIGFPLRMRKTPPPEIKRRVAEIAQLLGVETLLDRYPRQLSGGQRQRVAMGRALVREAKLFLFDEPLSNLDAQLRDDMRTEIKRLHQELAMTMIYVTHDQIEAMTLADRIVLMRDGIVEQVGSPLEVYEKPATRFVARFIGSPPINFIPASMGEKARSLKLTNGDVLEVPHDIASRWASLAGREIVLGVRPEHFAPRTTNDAAPREGELRVKVDLVELTGARAYVAFTLDSARCLAEIPASVHVRPGDKLTLAVDLSRAVVVDPDSDRVF